MAITREDELKQLETLKVSYQMYEDNKKSTLKRMKSALNPDGKKKFTEADIEEEMALIEEAQKEVVAKYTMFGGDPADLQSKPSKKKTTKTPVVDDILTVTAEEIYKQKETEKKTRAAAADTETIVEKAYVPSSVPTTQTTFDVIPLPSNGQCYKQKISRLPVAYLTAYDENMIIAPNLYRDNKIIDLMLENKVLNNTIDTMDLIDGDREAIILFLRANGYGNEYPITATDNETGIEFETVIDLSQLKYKDFNLQGDENGWFTFELPVSKKMVKFKYLSHRDILRLNEAEAIEDSKLKRDKLSEMVETMDAYIENDDAIDKSLKIKVRQAIRTIEDWKEGMDEDDALKFTHSVTNRLALAIQAVDDITDRKYIRDFVMNMNVRDSAALRKYMNANEPGIDYNITVQKPESLGGGSMNVFLQFDQYVFLNIA